MLSCKRDLRIICQIQFHYLLDDTANRILESQTIVLENTSSERLENNYTVLIGKWVFIDNTSMTNADSLVVKSYIHF